MKARSPSAEYSDKRSLWKSNLSRKLNETEKGYKYLVEECFWQKEERTAQRSSGDIMLVVVKKQQEDQCGWNCVNRENNDRKYDWKES